MTTVTMTGHRPEKILDPTWVKDAITSTLIVIGASHVIQGMAAGVDLWSARCAFMADIPYTCARPWAGHMPRVADRKDYESALKHAARIVDVDPSNGYPGKGVYDKRNRWMVDQLDADGIVLAVWDGSSGGTWNCVKYAIKKDKRVFGINPANKTVGWINEPE